MSVEAFAVLLVEDSLDHAELVVRHLLSLGFDGRVVHLQDGEDALAYLFHRDGYAANPPPLPDLVLLDLRLPRIDGIQVLREIKSSEALRCIPVVVLTSSSARGDIQAAYEAHANSYLVKPPDHQQFREMMATLGEYWVNWNKRPAAEAFRRTP